jgi:uncharacterized protein YceH (UPF0502 family)
VHDKGVMSLSIIGLIIVFGVLAVVVGGIVALIVFFAKRKKQPTVADQNLNERVKSLEIEVHAMKTKLENLKND